MLGELKACLAMGRDPAVTRFIIGPWTDPAVHRAFVETRKRYAFPAGMGYWTVLAPEGFAGWILLTPLNLHGSEIEIGRLVCSLWRCGYATEAACPVLAHALGTLGLDEVVADIDPANSASAGVARKLGLH
jgi:RimJ/RimL family protein N-acetyltransferase